MTRVFIDIREGEFILNAFWSAVLKIRPAEVAGSLLLVGVRVETLGTHSFVPVTILVEEPMQLACCNVVIETPKALLRL